MKPRVIFLHGLKTGGTSLRYMLLDEYGIERIAPVPIGDSIGEQTYPVLRGVNPLQYQRGVTTLMMSPYDVVMSHYDWEIVERLPGWEVITLLRHPVEQIRSLYQFMWQSPDFPTFQDTAGPFMEWVRGEGSKFLNSQTRLLSGHGCTSLDAAMRNLQCDRLSFGILELFGESVRRWNERFGWSMRVQHRNESEAVVQLSEREQVEVEFLQADDMQLYTDALWKFDER